MKISKVLAAAALCFGIATSASAAVVYDNGGPMGGGISNNAVLWVQANDFSVGSNSNITGGSVFIESQSGSFSNWNGTLNYFIFANNGTTPGVTLASGAAANKVITSTGILDQAGTGTIQRVDFDLATAFDALASTTYWFGIQLGTTGNIAWSASSYGNEIESYGGSFNNWYSNGRDGAFLLVGDDGTVPEPATLFLIGLGLLGLVRGRRRV